MNYIKHLTGFFEKVTHDKSLNPTHISLYMSLFQFWNCNRFMNPISISRDEVMRISKISSKATYHKCLKNLHALDYLRYEPSFNPFKGSHVIMFNFAEDLKPKSKARLKASSKNEPLFEPLTRQVVNKQETSTEQALVPYINNTNIKNISNNLNLGKHEQNFKNERSGSLNGEGDTSKQKKLPEKNKGFTIPAFKEVKTFFREEGFPELEAQKFYNYFSSIGWLVGGKIPMVDWQAGAQNWILNADKFNPVQKNLNNNLNTSTNKNYAEPL